MPIDLGYWPQLLFSVAVLTISLATALHALLRKRHSRSAAGWIALCLFFPLLGATLYWLIGQNRIYTRAEKLKGAWPSATHSIDGCPVTRETLSAVTEDPAQLETLFAIGRAGDAVTRRPLVPGNRITPLRNGEETYPAMLRAIAGAKERVYLVTYIFDGRRCLAEFGAALEAAVRRGVDVRLLIDGVGELYGWPRVSRYMAKRGVPVARFLPFSLSAKGLHINLRNHRKILAVDGAVGFTGGMNLRDVHYADGSPADDAVRDLHFEVEGPIVCEMEAAFLEDWGFSTARSDLRPPSPPAPPAGRAVCRAVQDGPNEDFDALHWTLLAAVAAARGDVRIVTPYFIPSRELVASLATAALSGASVRILIPERSNLPYVDWASRAMVGELLERGVRVGLQPKPFPHTKYLVVDQVFSSIGSANLDPRSLRLNFEFNLEVHDAELAQTLSREFDRDWSHARELTAGELDRLPLPIRIRNNLARLAEPYL
ncbi:MAG: cardiolipin synthase [Planctomycetaceae bacterium]|nr:cardiolipin synthase [Planctomycetaceae bacterium]